VKPLALVFVVACGASQPPRPVKTLQLNATGEAVDVEGAVVKGYVTLVDFWAEYCAPCTTVAAKIEAAVANEDRVIVRKVDVGDGSTPVAKAYDIGALPHWRVFDRHARLRYVLVGNDCLRAPELATELLAEP
jgi:thiol-disulfide isomerase/thioredoxin